MIPAAAEPAPRTELMISQSLNSVCTLPRRAHRFTHIGWYRRHAEKTAIGPRARTRQVCTVETRQRLRENELPERGFGGIPGVIFQTYAPSFSAWRFV